jgi:hypothetical protein
MSAPAIKKYNRFQQRAFNQNSDAYKNARRVYLPQLIEDRYSIKFSGGANSKNLDAKGHGLRLGLTESNGEQVWLANGTAVGDAVQAVQKLDKLYLNKITNGIQAIEIIEQFNKSEGVVAKSTHASIINTTEPKLFKLLAASGQDKEGKLFDYVTKARGIGWLTVNEAEAAGFLDKTKDGLRFVGRDEFGKPKSAETRLFSHAVGQSKVMCQAGSNRSFTPILPGKDKEIHIVEGGFSALGLREIMNRDCKNPTIIVTGGKDNISWTRQPHIQILLKGAEVTIWSENESSTVSQEITDLATNKMADAILSAGAECVIKAKPPILIKDTADWNFQQKKELREQKNKAESTNYSKSK